MQDTQGPDQIRVFFSDHCNSLYFCSNNIGLVKGFKQVKKKEKKKDQLTFLNILLWGGRVVTKMEARPVES